MFSKRAFSYHNIRILIRKYLIIFYYLDLHFFLIIFLVLQIFFIFINIS